MIRLEKLYVDLRSGVGLVVLCEQRDGLALLAGTTGTSDAVDVVLDCQGELQTAQLVF